MEMFVSLVMRSGVCAKGDIDTFPISRCLVNGKSRWFIHCCVSELCSGSKFLTVRSWRREGRRVQQGPTASASAYGFFVLISKAQILSRRSTFTVLVKFGKIMRERHSLGKNRSEYLVIDISLKEFSQAGELPFWVSHVIDNPLLSWLWKVAAIPALG
jgi:hypothetical protein